MRTLCADCGHGCHKALIVRCGAFAPKTGCAADAEAVAEVAREMHAIGGDLGSGAGRLLTGWADRLLGAMGPGAVGRRCANLRAGGGVNGCARFECSACGCAVGADDGDGGVFEAVFLARPSEGGAERVAFAFCPACGAKVAG